MSAKIRTDLPTMNEKKITSRTPLASIREMLFEDGFGHVDPKAVRTAAAKGCLLWTRERLTTTDASRIDARPECWTPTPKGL